MKYKKIILCFLFTFFMISLSCAFFSVSAEEDKLYLSVNQGSVRAGETVKVMLSFSGNNRLGILAQLQYDQELYSIEYCRPIESTGWTAERSANRIILYDTTQNHPIGAQTGLCEIGFRILADATGETFTVSVVNATASDGVSDATLEDVTLSVPILPPYSSDATLASLTVRGYELSPAFSPSVRSYTLSTAVPYADRELNIEAIPQDAGAAVSITGSLLKLGKNNIRILVTAEDGSQRVYTVSVLLTADSPNVDNGENRLSMLTPSAGILSPAFDMEVTHYVLYLPYEIRSITLTGTPYDARAKTEPVTSVLNGPGVTTLPVVCCAENGDVLRYWVDVVVLPQYSGTLPEIRPVESSGTESSGESTPETDPETDPKTEPSSSDPMVSSSLPVQSEERTSSSSGGGSGSGPYLWLLLILLAAGGGFAAGYLVHTSRTRKSNPK